LREDQHRGAGRECGQAPDHQHKDPEAGRQGPVHGHLRSTARRAFPRFTQQNLKVNLPLLERIEQIASEHQTTSSGLSLAWLLAQGPDIVAIPGARRRSHLIANAQSAQTLLDEATLQALRKAVAPDEIAGTRTSPHDADIEL
jgi:aryl-alcohol dehydrogenase-like predicted oxidoreductase